MTYFLNYNSNNKNNYLIMRKNRMNLLDLANSYKFVPGDILVLFFWNKGLIFNFEGVCLGIRKKSLEDLNVSFILRNVLFNVGVELVISFIYNRLFFLKIDDYKRKKFYYRKSKLFYLRNKLNRESRVR